MSWLQCIVSQMQQLLLSAGGEAASLGPPLCGIFVRAEIKWPISPVSMLAAGLVCGNSVHEHYTDGVLLCFFLASWYLVNCSVEFFSLLCREK